MYYLENSIRDSILMNSIESSLDQTTIEASIECSVEQGATLDEIIVDYQNNTTLQLPEKSMSSRLSQFAQRNMLISQYTDKSEITADSFVQRDEKMKTRLNGLDKDLRELSFIRNSVHSTNIPSFDSVMIKFGITAESGFSFH